MTRPRTSKSPAPHGTTTRTAPKQTVTFIFTFVVKNYSSPLRLLQIVTNYTWASTWHLFPFLCPSTFTFNSAARYAMCRSDHLQLLISYTTGFIWYQKTDSKNTCAQISISQFTYKIINSLALNFHFSPHLSARTGISYHTVIMSINRTSSGMIQKRIVFVSADDSGS